MRLDGCRVAITGGARGIGYATARELLARGAKVAIGDIDEAALKESATRLGAGSHSVLDVTEPESFARFLDRAEADLGGPIDVLVNNAGIMPTGRVVDETDATTRRMLEINVLGVITGTKLALRRMLPRRSGHVVNVASLAGETYVPGVATYAATKWAVLGFTESVRLENRGSGVEFTCIQPWFTNTELVSGTRGVPGFPNVEPADIAKAIATVIRRPRPRVRVGRRHGALIVSQRFLPRRVVEALNRALGGTTVFLDVDEAARRAYLDRIRDN